MSTGTADKPRRLENTVRLRVSVSDFPKDWDFSPAMWECWLVGKLKDAGVPVEGTLVFRGIKSGTLTRFDDPEDFGATIYVWEPNGCGDRTWFTAEQWEKLNAWDDVDTYGPSA